MSEREIENIQQLLFKTPKTNQTIKWIQHLFINIPFVSESASAKHAASTRMNREKKGFSYYNEWKIIEFVSMSKFALRLKFMLTLNTQWISSQSTRGEIIYVYL